jgi:MMPL family
MRENPPGRRVSTDDKPIGAVHPCSEAAARAGGGTDEGVAEFHLSHRRVECYSPQGSSTHRKGVVRGWLAFVIVAFALGGATGMVTIKRVGGENGQSRLADETQARQFPRERAGEEVLIENPSGPLAGTGYRAAVADLVTRLSSTPSVAAIKSPLAPGNAGQISKNGHAALVTFQITGDPDTAQNRVAPALAATAAVQRAYPGLFVGELGAASSVKAVNALITDDFHRAEGDLGAGHAVHSGARVRRAGGGRRAVAARLHRGHRGARRDRAAEPPVARRFIDYLGDPAYRVGGRYRLLAVLRAPSARGARRRPHACGSAASGRGDLRPGGADLRRHRDDRDDGHVPDGATRCSLHSGWGVCWWSRSRSSAR